MIEETWIKNGKKIVVGQDPQCEWRYEIKDGCLWISGLSLFSLMNDGWVRLND